jgi:hypothetical protein
VGVPNWKRFEELVASIQQELAPDAKVTLNDKIIGKRTGVARQIDVSIRKSVGQFELLIVIDCKDHGRPLDVKDVEEFMGLVQDVAAHRAAMVASQGFTETAKKRAEDAGIELYRVIDTGDHPWKVTAFLPAICIFTGIKAFALRFSGTGPFRMRTDIDHREMTLFDRDGVSIGKVKDLVWARWNDRKFPEEQGRYDNLEFVENPVKIETHGQLYEINVHATLIVESRVYSGKIRLSEISGFLNELTGATFTRSITTESIEWAEVERSWTRIENINDLAVQPALILRALDVYGRR